MDIIDAVLCSFPGLVIQSQWLDALLIGMHRYHFFTNRYEYEYFYSCTCRYRVPILLRFGLHESAINFRGRFYFILCRLCQAYSTKLTEGYPKPKINRAFCFFFFLKHKKKKVHTSRENAKKTQTGKL